MKHAPSPSANRSALNETGGPSDSVPYRLIWWLNTAATLLALGFFAATDMVAPESLAEGFGAYLFYAATSLCLGLLLVAAGSAIFLLGKKLLQRFSAGQRAGWLWLGLPVWIPALLLFAYSVWKCLPQQRLKEVCRGHRVAARDIRVVGMTGLQLAEWFATFKVNRDEWQKLAKQLDLEVIPQEEFTAQLGKIYMLGRTALVAGIRADASTNATYYKWEFTGVDGNLHGNIYASYDGETSRAVVMRSGF